MTRRYVQHLTDGESIEEIYLVLDKQMRANRNGNLYLQLDLRDRTGAINARLWNAGEHLFRSFDVGDFLQVKGKVQLFQGALQMILSHLDRVETQKVELADFLPHTEQDVSKLLELSSDRAFAYTDEGQLIGPLIIGVEMLNEKALKVRDLTGEPFPPELLLRLKHMILSHHGSYEFGSPKLPMTPEAIALNALDNFDAKVHRFTRDIREDSNKASAWTPFDPSMQRRLFKGGPAGDDAPPAEAEGRASPRPRGP